MFLKVETEGSETVFYRLSKHEIYAGSALSNHLVISDKTVSKRHLKLMFEGEQWFVVDQGSTNGSYLDGEQLVPGKKFEFSPEGPVLLGANVTFTLVTEADNPRELKDLPSDNPAMSSAQASIQSDSDRTRVITLDDLRNAKAIAEKKRKRELAEKYAKIKKRRLEDLNLVGKYLVIALAIIMVGIFATKILKKKLKQQAKKETIISTMKTKARGDEEIETDIEGFRIPRKVLLSRNRIIGSFGAKKCRTEREKEICGDNSTLSIFDNGILEILPGTFVVYLEQKSQINSYRALLTPDNALDPETFNKAVFLNFFHEHFLAHPIPEQSQLYVAFYRYNPQTQIPEMKNIAAMNKESTVLMAAEFAELKLSGSDEEIISAVNRLNSYFTFY